MSSSLVTSGQAGANNFMSRFRDTNTKALKHLTSQQFLEVWNNYDQDGNGFIEGSELDSFLREFVSSIREADQEPLSEALLQELKKAFMDAYDNNKDGRIDIRELAQLLPLDESFMLLFRFENQVDSSVEFMKIWTRYDVDSSGFIDADELKNFLRDLLIKQQSGSSSNKHHNRSNSVNDDKLEEYTQTLLKIFDQNKDGKLQLSEMTRLLSIKENFLQCSGIFRGSKKLVKQDIERIFKLYDRDHNGIIENEELKGFIKDLMDFLGKDPETQDIEEFKRMVMQGCDSNGDGKINKKELTIVLLALSKHALDEEAQAELVATADD